jgi:hypothetical protein
MRNVLKGIGWCVLMGVLYVASYGPLARFRSFQNSALYRPLLWSVDRSPRAVQGAFYSYHSWWTGYRTHGGTI